MNKPGNLLPMFPVHRVTYDAGRTGAEAAPMPAPAGFAVDGGRAQSARALPQRPVSAADR